MKKRVQKIRIKEPVLSASKKQILWEKIEQTILRRQQLKIVRMQRWTKAAAAAAVFLLLAGGAYIYTHTRSRQAVDIDYASILDDTQSLQSKSISLILPDNRVVAIEDDHSNVAYDQEGRINVNAKPIEETRSESKGSALNTLVVPYGKTLSLTLNDGTKVWVNSGSKLIYPSVFEKNKREIYLTGEIYLDVTKEEGRPFIVKTNLMDVNVLGTKFNVSAYAEDPVQSVVLVSGAVCIKSKTLKGDYSLYPDQMLSYGVNSNQVGIREVNVNFYTSWIHEYLLLQSENLDRVLQKIEKHFNVPIHYQAADIAPIRVSGKLDLKGTVENALNYISATTPVDYRIDEAGVSIELTSIK